MNDRWAVVLALATAAGAWAARPLPLLLGPALALFAIARRSPMALCIAAALLASAMGARAWAGLHPPAVGRFHGGATLVGDPTDVASAGGAVRVDLRVRAKRVEAWARGPTAWRLRQRLAGERVVVRGRLRPVPPALRARLAARHVAARATVDEVRGWEPGNGLTRLANGLRRTLLSGAESLPPVRRALFAGFVLGDDRDQRPEVIDDFRASGLSHLLVVSGENVAFVLALASPALGRLTLRARVVAGIAVLIVFGALTRWEPSVLRAEAMAVLALTAAAMGRPQSTVRLLALAVTGLVLVDPLLLRSVGFLLSVGASLGIALLSAPLTKALPGPRSLASAVAVTAAAQVGVAPVAVPVFGALPVASLPANVLALPAAGPVMAWGLAAGLPAGLIGGWPAKLVHVPTGLLVGWVAFVARATAALHLGWLRLPHLLVLVMCAVAGAVAPPGARRRSVAAVAAATLLWPAFVSPEATARGVELCRGALLWRDGPAVVLVADRPDPVRLLDALGRRGVGGLDVVVAKSPSADLGPVFTRHRPRVVLVGEAVTWRGAVVAEPGQRLAAGRIFVEVLAVRPRLDVRVRSPPTSPSSGAGAAH